MREIVKFISNYRLSDTIFLTEMIKFQNKNYVLAILYLVIFSVDIILNG